jgi:hypothetical protein
MAKLQAIRVVCRVKCCGICPMHLRGGGVTGASCLALPADDRNPLSGKEGMRSLCPLEPVPGDGEGLERSVVLLKGW